MTDKRRRMPRADRERQMLAVAERVFAERGFRSASMDEIAELVGVTKPMLYAYFGSKDGLLLACIRRARTELREVTSRAIAAADGPLDSLRRGLVAHFTYLDAHTHAWAMLRNEYAAIGAVSEEIESIRRQQTELIARACRQFVPEARQAGATTLVEVYAEMLVGATERMTLWRERNPGVTPEQAADLMLAVIGPGVARFLDRAGTPWEKTFS